MEEPDDAEGIRGTPLDEDEYKRARLVVECPTLTQPLLIPMAKDATIRALRETVQQRMAAQHAPSACPSVLSLSLEEDNKRVLLADDDVVGDVIYSTTHSIKVHANLESLVRQQDDDDESVAIEASAEPYRELPPAEELPGWHVAVKGDPTVRGRVTAVKHSWITVKLATDDDSVAKYRRADLEPTRLTDSEVQFARKDVVEEQPPTKVRAQPKRAAAQGVAYTPSKKKPKRAPRLSKSRPSSKKPAAAQASRALIDSQWAEERDRDGGFRLPVDCPPGLNFVRRTGFWECKREDGLMKTMKTTRGLVMHCNKLARENKLS